MEDWDHFHDVVKADRHPAFALSLFSFLIHFYFFISFPPFPLFPFFFSRGLIGGMENIFFISSSSRFALNQLSTILEPEKFSKLLLALFLGLVASMFELLVFMLQKSLLWQQRSK